MRIPGCNMTTYQPRRHRMCMWSMILHIWETIYHYCTLHVMTCTVTTMMGRKKDSPKVLSCLSTTIEGDFLFDSYACCCHRLQEWPETKQRRRTVFVICIHCIIEEYVGKSRRCSLRWEDFSRDANTWIIMTPADNWEERVGFCKANLSQQRQKQWYFKSNGLELLVFAARLVNSQEAPWLE